MCRKEKTEPNYFEYQKDSWLKRNWIPLLIIILGVGSIFLIFISQAFRGSNAVNAENAAQLGDFIGGFIGTVFALVSVVLLVITLNNQRESLNKEKFESKFFELLKYQRDNVAELTIGGEHGKKIFVLLIREFREILDIVKEVRGVTNQSLKEKELLIISYHVLFFGVGPNSSRQLKKSLSHYGFASTFVDELERSLNNDYIKAYVKEKRNFNFIPFEGHQVRLGHYYRHLYQSVMFVDREPTNIDKYFYIKTLRAQMTTHEQALFYLNSLSRMGSIWRDEERKLITYYKLVKNIPEDFFNKESEVNIEEDFPKDYFEHQQNQSKTS
ncbi:MAG: putative phage abortive infection protein [Fluviicola sp.]